MGCKLSRPHKCGLCLSEDCKRKARLCGECMFVRHFIVNHGREALKSIASHHAVVNCRGRTASLPQHQPAHRPIQRTRTETTWCDDAPQSPFQVSAPPYHKHSGPA